MVHVFSENRLLIVHVSMRIVYCSFMFLVISSAVCSCFHENRLLLVHVFSENRLLIVHVFSENRLLIIHGLMDENVHFLHTRKLVNALVKACKPHTLRHGIRSHEASEHYRVLVLNFLKHNL
ncbi:hypothetical protein DPMN_038436 [Dreissena polymorpha]|uniref:Peptidase S9 prolyl oligopeptidase catalytic domain-containing protein n=1 Tax=Dreissena polymorpha TaxID=45954 RepID=A0A9D4RQ86_DREPO|nr:hypothetical protein DPMN_038436 [Dreissena polymorpha]